MLKFHYVPTAERAQLVAPGISAYGAVTLNHAVSGLNPVAVEIAGRSGAPDRVDAHRRRGQRDRRPTGRRREEASVLGGDPPSLHEALVIWLDDALEYGKRNTLKKWWLDLEIVHGRVVEPKGANGRDLYLDRKLPDGNEGIAVYPVSTLPGPDDEQAVPLDRQTRARGLPRRGTRARTNPICPRELREL